MVAENSNKVGGDLVWHACARLGKARCGMDRDAASKTHETKIINQYEFKQILVC